MGLEVSENGHDHHNQGRKTPTKPHVVLVPFPAQSHMKAMLKMGKLLHHKGFHITYVNTEFNHQRFLKVRGADSLNGVPGFQFETIPDGLPPSDADATQDVYALCQAVRTNFLAPFRGLLARLNQEAANSCDGSCPPVTCILSDGVMPFTVDAAKELQIPVVVYWTFAACAFLGFNQYRPLRDMGLTPLKDESELTKEYLDTAVDWIPGINGLRLRDMPTLFQTTDPDHPIFNLAMEAVEAASRASAVGLQTFDALEPQVLDHLSSKFPHIFTIAPLQLLLNQISSKQLYLESIGYNLWIEESECLRWLESKGDRTIVYVNFGSVIPVTHSQLVEFAWGLANSLQYFLWIIRPDLVRGDSAVLPPQFLEETKGRGLIASWCPQEEVLSHPSVGGFLTHCGWNSTIESLTAGVPMICWPFFADQQTNSRYACIEWGVGTEIDSEVKRCDVENLVRELMEGEKGKKMRTRAMEWKKLAELATGPNGSSSQNLDKLVNLLLSKS